MRSKFLISSSVFSYRVYISNITCPKLISQCTSLTSSYRGLPYCIKSQLKLVSCSDHKNFEVILKNYIYYYIRFMQSLSNPLGYCIFSNINKWLEINRLSTSSVLSPVKVLNILPGLSLFPPSWPYHSSSFSASVAPHRSRSDALKYDVSFHYH